MSLSAIKRVTASGEITAHETRLRGAVLMAGAATTVTLALRTGGAAGAVQLSLSCLAGSTVSVDGHDAEFSDGIYAEVSGDAPVASVIYG